ncbi:MOSC N-terminal beta barrel domain-containing protein [Spirillospora sp. NPDC047279]|uniref:MOSC domain-containing protein n=1 Tax=Spirillospora sp. NPDC047279 TaxID=3155478 RepID=UPI0033F7AC21
MTTTLGTVAALRRHPVKSMLGEEVTAADVSPRGIAGDRVRALVDRETGKIASAKNPRLWRALLTMSATLRNGTVQITLPDGTTVADEEAGTDEALSAFLGRAVTLTGTPPSAATLDRSVPEEVLAAGVTAEVGAEEITIGLGAPPGGFVDFAPVHLIGTATLAAIGAASPHGVVEPARYRPNLIIETAGPAYGENGWKGRELAIGDEVVLRGLFPTPRCAVPTLEHGDLPRDPDALRVPARDNRMEPLEGLGPSACAGAYAEVVRPGRVRQGDTVSLL